MAERVAAEPTDTYMGQWNRNWYAMVGEFVTHEEFDRRAMMLSFYKRHNGFASGMP